MLATSIDCYKNHKVLWHCHGIVDTYFTAGLFLGVTSQAMKPTPGNIKSRGNAMDTPLGQVPWTF